jgi:hypothetical protein
MMEKIVRTAKPVQHFSRILFTSISLSNEFPECNCSGDYTVKQTPQHFADRRRGSLVNNAWLMSVEKVKPLEEVKPIVPLFHLIGKRPVVSLVNDSIEETFSLL